SILGGLFQKKGTLGLADVVSVGGGLCIPLLEVADHAVVRVVPLHLGVLRLASRGRGGGGGRSRGRGLGVSRLNDIGGRTEQVSAGAAAREDSSNHESD